MASLLEIVFEDIKQEVVLPFLEKVILMPNQLLVPSVQKIFWSGVMVKHNSMQSVLRLSLMRV